MRDTRFTCDNPTCGTHIHTSEKYDAPAGWWYGYAVGGVAFYAHKDSCMLDIDKADNTVIIEWRRIRG